MVSEKVDPQRFVFVDEMGTNTSLSPLYAWSRREGVVFCASQPWAEHHLAFEHEP